MNQAKSGDRIILERNDGGFDLCTVSRSGLRLPSPRQNFRGTIDQVIQMARLGLHGGTVWTCKEDTPDELLPIEM